MINELGFTGTQRGMTIPQIRSVGRITIYLQPKRAHHGDCVGADAQFAVIARMAGATIVGHPPIKDGKRAFFPSDEEWDPKDFLVRNQDIVDVSDLMLGTPQGLRLAHQLPWSRYLVDSGPRSSLANALRDRLP